ncbi:Six-hairpin glycosidase [Sarocladium strictum]
MNLFFWARILPLAAVLCSAEWQPRPPTIIGDIRLTEITTGTWEALVDSKERPVIELEFGIGRVFALDSPNGSYISPTDPSFAKVGGFGGAWFIPENITDGKSIELSSYMIIADGPLIAECQMGHRCHVKLEATAALVIADRARPHNDAHGGDFSFDFEGGSALEDALAAFYWTSMLPMVIERTRAVDYPDSDGFVISTLGSTYAGTYPDVDHEFQIKGRIAMGSDLDLAVVRRTIELDLRLAREDYCDLWRTPCAVQPDGSREYNVQRKSKDGSTMAVMFLISGNVELVESVWLYVARTKNIAWLEENIGALDSVAKAVESHIDDKGRLWSDVCYEDQVMKDGRETMSAALAARSFGLLAELLDLVGRSSTASHYRTLQLKLSDAVSAPLPQGSWDPEENRFIDWVDRSGWAHDHIHLLANILPVMFGMATEAQSSSVMELIEAEMNEFQRFPTFLAARIQDYNSSEIGDGGPYDLCAAGRYWCWDAAFWSWRGNRGMLRQQLHTVAEMAESEGYIMGERYDMDHVYYIDGSPWHGAAHYYEYPCVFAWVLIHDYIGVKPSLEFDLEINPKVADFGKVTLRQAAYRLSYEYREEWFELTSLADESRTFKLDLTALYESNKSRTTSDFLSGGAQSVLQKDRDGPSKGSRGTIVQLSPGESIRILESDV